MIKCLILFCLLSPILPSIINSTVDKFYADTPGIPFSFFDENYTTDLLINTFIPYSVLLIPSSQHFLINSNIKSNTSLAYDDNYKALLYQTTLTLNSVQIPNYLIYFVEDSIWTRDEGLSFSYPPVENYSIILSLYKNKHIEHMKFAFHNIRDDLNASFYIGGVPDNSHLSLPYQGVIPIDEDLPTWGFYLNKVTYKSKEYKVNFPTVISSGLSEMLISDELYDLLMNNIFKDYFDNQTCVEYMLKWMAYEHKSFECKEKIMNDNLYLMFGDVTFRLTPDDVFNKYNRSNIFSNSKQPHPMHNYSGVIMGIGFINKINYTVFDYEKKQVEFYSEQKIIVSNEKSNKVKKGIIGVTMGVCVINIIMLLFKVREINK